MDPLWTSTNKQPFLKLFNNKQGKKAGKFEVRLGKVFYLNLEKGYRRIWSDQFSSVQLFWRSNNHRLKQEICQRTGYFLVLHSVLDKQTIK